ncbi:MAG: RNA polymerase sigma factor [Clostridiales bacterium]|nr:RNA polymerase sigma factor [Clostridiales bacterium]
MDNIIGEIFEENYTKFKHHLIARFNQLNEYDAEDIIQQTAMKLLYKGNDILSVENLTSYVYSSLRNGAIDHFKKRKNEVLSAEYIEQATPSAEQELLDSELKKIIKKAIDALDKKSKYIFVETEIKGRSYKEIMLETGERLGTLLSRKSRATKKLTVIIQDYLNEYL